MKRKALFVGVNTYEDEQIRNLDFSLSDAHALKTMFELFGFESDILENPSKGDVFHAVRQMTADLRAGDLFFFYFAGHGWTTTSGKHLLFCSDDMYEDLRDDDAGISFDKLKRKTTGDYNRAFVLDACRSDFITGTRGGDTTTRDLRPIGELVKDAPVKSSLAVLRSCSQYEHALEIRSRKHGLFTLAMMEILRTSKECGSELLFGESLCDAVTDKMLCIAKAEGITAEQTPEFAKSGLAQVLIEGSKAASSSKPLPTAGAQDCVVCPICGKHNLVTETFRCKVCGKDHICLSHFSSAHNSCGECAKGAALSQQKSVSELYKNGEDRFYGRNGEAQDYVEAVMWYRKSAEQGDEGAKECLDELESRETEGGEEDIVLEGENSDGDADGTNAKEQDDEELSARELFEQGENYYNGQDRVKEDRAKAFEFYQRAANLGLADAQYSLGYMYAYGESSAGVAKDSEKALFWYRKAAAQGHAKAARFVGETERTVQEAQEFNLIRCAAEQGDANAQYSLGQYYRNQGDRAEAAKWIRRAAEQGQAQARLVLQLLD